MDEMMALMDEYVKSFGKTFPSFQLMGLGEDGVIAIIRECLETGKTPYELGYLRKDVFY